MPKTFTMAAAVIALALGLVGCAGEPDAPSAAVEQSSGPPQVGEEALCLQLVPHLEETVRLINIVNSKTPDRIHAEQDELADLVSNLIHDQNVAPDDLKPHIQQQIDVVSKIQDVQMTGGQLSIDYQNFKSSGLELATRCGQYAG
jgi:hypothetical protein